MSILNLNIQEVVEPVGNETEENMSFEMRALKKHD